MSYMKLNTDKYHLLVPRNKNRQMWAKLDIVWERNDVKPLAITLNNKKNLINMCPIFAQKLTVH